MHITFIIQDMYRLGAQYVTSLLATGLFEHGHKIDIIVSANETKIKLERPELVPFEMPDKVTKIILSSEKASKNIWALRKYLKENKPDVIVPMSSTYVLPAALALRSLMIKTKLIPVEHSSGIGLNLKKATKTSHINNFLLGIGNFFLSNRINHVITVSKGVKDALIQTKKFRKDKIFVIYNPVINQDFYNKLKQQTIHPWLNDKDIPVIVAAGAHVPFKGYDILIKAMAEVNKTHSCRLILFGEGKLTIELKTLAKNLSVEGKVDFAGYTNNLPAELKNADAFVISSHAESFSIVLVEALASGIPVVSTNCPSGPPEILQNGKYGILVEPNNPNDLARGILHVLDGKGIIPPPESWNPYLLEKVTQEYENILNKIINS